MMMNGETKDPSQIIYPSDSMSSSTSAIHSIKDAEVGDYCVFLKVSDDFDENYTDEERKKLIEFYMEKISLHEKSKYVTDPLNQPMKNQYKDSGFDLVVPWVKDGELEMNGKYFYKSGEKKLCNMRVQIAVYKVTKIQQQTNLSYLSILQPSPYYLYARSSIYKTPFILANNVRIIDTGYRGNICAALYNTNRDEPSLVKMGTRMTQICMPGLCPNFHVRLVKKLSDTSRGAGGFGSTGQ
tara:strand:+ start:67 stop:786 length:720 start_codon:yes stop_codon:yes gene_type:complete